MAENEQPNEPFLPDEVEQIVTDYLLGEYELEKLEHGFLPPVISGEPCPEQQAAFGQAEFGIEETVE
ncbi:hypothetical protein [Effusibacillus consociatus]|uniref:Uncharacterized protein n=1 Tax=Effusibacillus consociatus TaxID=1117041 RepID=A0ABV9Q2R8_9BACL